MAYSDNQYTMSIKDLIVYRAGTTVQLPVAQAASVSPMIVSGILRGSSKIASVNAFIEGAEGQIGMGGWPLLALQIMLGIAAPTPTGTTPNRVTNYAIPATTALPYFSIVGRTQDGVGGDVHLYVPQAKITKSFTLDVKDGATYVAPSIDFTAIPDSGGMPFYLISYETTTPVATSLPAGTTKTATAGAITAGIVTLTSAAHGLGVAQWITIAGCTDTAAEQVNGLKQIISASADTFTFSAIGAANDAALTGTITATY